jgi:hypothetical protein
MPVKGSSGLPPRPPISRCNSEVIDPATVKAAVSSCLKSEENSPPPDSKVCMEVVFLDEKVIFFFIWNNGFSLFLFFVLWGM